MSIELDFIAHVLALNLPRGAEREPIFRVFHLVALLADFLLEDAVVVANAISRGRDVLGGERVQVACRKSP